MKSPLIAGLSILLAACGSEEAPDSTKPPVTITPPIITTPEPDTEPQDRGELIIGVERCEYEDGSLGNCPPVAQAGPDIEVNNDAASVHLHRLATDIDNLDSQLVYTWEQLSGTPVIIRTSNSINYFQIPELQFTSQVLVFRQTVSDGESLDTDEVRYTLPPLIKTIRDDGLYETDIGCFSLEGVKVNCPPIADAGEDILVEYDQISVSIYGTSTDADRTYPDTTWSQISGPDVELVF